MIISEDRQSHIAHLITDSIWQDDLVDYSDEDAALRFIKKGVAAFVNEAEQIDQAVQIKIKSLKREVIPDTPEWDVMYQKYYEEEIKRRGEN